MSISRASSMPTQTAAAPAPPPPNPRKSKDDDGITMYKTMTFTYLAERSQVPSSQLRQCKFPANTRGFLYWHSGLPQPTAKSASGEQEIPPPTAVSSIRFSLLPNPRPSKLQSEGSDLLPTGGPWIIPLLSLLTKPKYDPIRQLLLDDALIAPSLLESIDGLKTTGSVFARLGEPWLCDFTWKTFLMQFEDGGGGEVMLTLTDSKETRNKKSGVTGYEGIGIVQLHRITNVPEAYSYPGGSTLWPSSTSPRASTTTDHNDRFREPANRNLKPTNPRAWFVLKVLDVLTRSPSPSQTPLGSPYPSDTPDTYLLSQTTNTFFRTCNPHTQREDIWAWSTRMDLVPPELLDRLAEVEWEDVLRARRDIRGEEDV
ncbi:hypothetical protein FA15DRAFT_708888 [Coprinopsis marcescibilis]|uniref:Uncharacterized protein n=1 Tax=Coprinopsis marcescibilis TaxID=230819 RepID=A0A5C3KHM9_COPMA|nr:hypothetical protein FA15DRAFT_708888 [Coprinopsis marcescibilis]